LMKNMPGVDTKIRSYPGRFSLLGMCGK